MAWHQSGRTLVEDGGGKMDFSAVEPGILFLELAFDHCGLVDDGLVHVST